MDRGALKWGLAVALVAVLVIATNGVAQQNVDKMLAPYETGDRKFERREVGDLIVFFHQRMLGDAIVEKDSIVYQFDKETAELKDTKMNWREDLVDTVPPQQLQISKEQAERMVEGEVLFSQLWIISPESDVFPLDPTPANPCWVVRSKIDGEQISTVIDAVTGQFLGYGIVPPYEGFSLSGPMYWDPCRTDWYNWRESARVWYNQMGPRIGYSTESVWSPTQATVQNRIQNPSIVMFYELAHGGSYSFCSGCTGGTGCEATTPAEVTTWLSSLRKMPFTFLGSCEGMCDTGAGTLSNAFRKGSSESTATVGYCHMDASYCGTCWTVSVAWQDRLFYYMDLGYTVSAAVNQALADYPSCLNATNGNCMRFAGDSYLKIGTRDEIFGVGGTWTVGTWYRNLASETWNRAFSSTPDGEIAVCDVTGDKRDDMVSIWASGLWFQNAATLGWTQVHTKAPAHIACGDITGDGWEEIVGYGGTWNTGIWYRNVRFGTWTHAYAAATPTGDVAVGDVTGDGRADMVTIWPSGLWYLNGSTLGWTQVHTKPPTRIGCGDVTGDGWDEIVGYGGTWTAGIWYRNVRYATWTRAYTGTPTGRLAVGDVTGDRRADMINIWPSGLWYLNGRTLGWTQVYSKAPDRIAAGDISGN